MYNLSFKHIRVINGGTIGSDGSYSVVYNIQEINNNPNFFTDLMQTAITDGMALNAYFFVRQGGDALEK